MTEIITDLITDQPLTAAHTETDTMRVGLHGGSVLIDRADYDLVTAHTWYVTFSGYVFRTTRDPRDYELRDGHYLHRYVLERKLGRPLKPGERGFFLNGDKADCSRANLVTYMSHEARAVRRAQRQELLGQQRGGRSPWTA